MDGSHISWIHTQTPPNYWIQTNIETASGQRYVSCLYMNWITRVDKVTMPRWHYDLRDYMCGEWMGESKLDADPSGDGDGQVF